MSTKMNDAFIESLFYKAFQALKNTIEQKPINKLNTQELQAFARLKKVVKYIDTYITMIDYDLLTEQDLCELNSHESNICKCNEELSSFIAHPDNDTISNANNAIDACLPTIKNIFPKFILPKESIKNIYEAYSKMIDESLQAIDFDTTVKASKKILALEQEQKIEKINEFFDKIYKGSDENSSLEEQKDDIYNEITALKTKIEESSNKQEELDKYHTKIFGENGLEHEIATRLQALETLKKKIESLMPNATSVGLAKAFADEKENFRKNIENWNRRFFACILGMLVFALAKTVYLIYLKADLSSLQGTINFIISGIPIFAPLVWLANYCAKRRSEHAMLLQEYTHKETFANSYSSYKQQIEELQDEDKTLLNELLKQALAIIAKNPTHVLYKKHSGDLPADDVKKILKAFLHGKANTKQKE